MLPSAKGLSFTLCWVSLPTSFHLRSKHLCQLCIDSYILAYLHSSYYFMLTIIHEICMLKVESNCWNLYLPLCCFDAFTLNLLLYELTLVQDFWCLSWKYSSWKVLLYVIYLLATIDHCLESLHSFHMLCNSMIKVM